MKIEVKVLGPLMVVKNCLALFKDIQIPRYRYHTTLAHLYKLKNCIMKPMTIGDYYDRNWPFWATNIVATFHKRLISIRFIWIFLSILKQICRSWYMKLESKSSLIFKLRFLVSHLPDFAVRSLGAKYEMKSGIKIFKRLAQVGFPMQSQLNFASLHVL